MKASEGEFAQYVFAKMLTRRQPGRGPFGFAYDDREREREIGVCLGIQ